MKLSILSKKLKETRQSHGISIKKLSKMLGEISIPIGIKTIYKWESGDIIPDLKCMGALATIYNTSISSFFEDNEFCQALDTYENDFINNLRNNIIYKKIIYLLVKKDKGEIRNGI